MALTAEGTGRSTVLKPLQVHTPTETGANFVTLLVARAAFMRKTGNCFMQLPDLLRAGQHPTRYSLNWSSEEKSRL